jgi:hypothetical protein
LSSRFFDLAVIGNHGITHGQHLSTGLSKLVYIVLLLDNYSTALKVSSAIFYPLNSNAGFKVGSISFEERAHKCTTTGNANPVGHTCNNEQPIA